MAAADWRSKQAYPDAKTVEAEDIAWECLRRDLEYERDYEALTSSQRSDATTDRFRRKWGLSFRRGSANGVRQTGHFLGARGVVDRAARPPCYRFEVVQTVQLGSRQTNGERASSGARWMACHRAARRREAPPLAERTAIETLSDCRRSPARPRFRHSFAGGTALLASARTASRRPFPTCSADPDPALAHPCSACSRWMGARKQLSRNRARPVRRASHSRSRLENKRCSQPDHSPGQEGVTSHPWRLSRIAPSQAQRQVR
ncbi:hypothetical protein ACVILL_000977 [Bradyrhizobium sp. USDA 3364]